MKKALSIVAAVLCLLGLSGFWWVQSYIGSREMIENIRQLMSRRLGGDITFEKPEINLFSGLRLGNIRLTAATVDAAPFLSMENAELLYSPLSLLRHRIELKVIRLQKPELVFLQQADGGWAIPRPNAEAASETLTFETGFMRFEVLLKDFDLSHGSVEVRTAANETLFRASDVNLHGNLHLLEQNAAADGGIQIGEIRFGPHLSLHKVYSPITLRDNTLTLTELTGEASGGRAQGTVQINSGSSNSDPVYKLNLKLTDLELLSLMKDFDANPEFIHGKMNINCEIQGNLRQPRVLSGRGSLESQSVQLTGFKALDALGSMLKLPDLRYTKFDSIKGSYKISDEQLTFYSLEAISPNLKMTGTGSIKFDRSMNFDILLVISPELARQIPAQAGRQFSRREDGSLCITFKLGGNLDSPKTNLAEKLLGLDTTSP